MSDERTELSLGDLARWSALAALVVAGIVLYLWLAPDMPAVLQPSTTN